MPMGNTLKLEDLLKPGCLPDESDGGENWRILHGDTLKLVKGFQPGIFDAVVTDPPYASGGTKQNERNRTTNQKYSSMKAENALPDFDGDNKDQRSWTHWMAEWLYDVRKACKKGAPICLFIDWRQYPSITDALQWAGWIWRGTAVWDKGNSRPQKGRFRQQAEYIVWGSNGPMPINRPVSCLPGVFRYGNPQNRIHVTEKPLQLMKDVIQICEPGGLILDPFAGAGTTILAAAESGYQAVGIEVTDAYYKLGRDRKSVISRFLIFIKVATRLSSSSGIESRKRPSVLPYFCQPSEPSCSVMQSRCWAIASSAPWKNIKFLPALFISCSIDAM